MKEPSYYLKPDFSGPVVPKRPSVRSGASTTRKVSVASVLIQRWAIKALVQ